MLRTRRARSCNIHEILQLVFPYVEIDSVPGHFEIPSETLFRKLGTKKGFSGVLELAAGAPGSIRFGATRGKLEKEVRSILREGGTLFTFG